MTYLPHSELDDGHAELSFATARLDDADPRSSAGSTGSRSRSRRRSPGFSGSRLGRRFVSDVGIATRAVRETGAADVLRGSRVRREARFDSVILLMDAVDSLGGVFREFASAQERAIDARAATERMRGLFLASMSHDLKSPLNAILGFAELVSRSPLSAAQQESLTIIEQRGRELLTLIHTVLDSARVEAGELRVSPEWTMVGDVVMSAVLDARELAVGLERRDCRRGDPARRAPALRRRLARRAGAHCGDLQRRALHGARGRVHVRATPPRGGPRASGSTSRAQGRTAPRAPKEARSSEAFKDADRARRHGSLGAGPLARPLDHGDPRRVDRAGGHDAGAAGCIFHRAPSRRRSCACRWRSASRARVGADEAPTLGSPNFRPQGG